MRQGKYKIKKYVFTHQYINISMYLLHLILDSILWISSALEGKVNVGTEKYAILSSSSILHLTLSNTLSEYSFKSELQTFQHEQR